MRQISQIRHTVAVVISYLNRGNSKIARAVTTVFNGSGIGCKITLAHYRIRRGKRGIFRPDSKSFHHIFRNFSSIIKIKQIPTLIYLDDIAGNACVQFKSL